LSALLTERAPQQAAPHELDWSQIVDFSPSLAEVFGRDRVWLAGDAAHTASPLGVQSMNRGLYEVCQLVDVMVAVLAGKEEPKSLERLATAQRDEWLRTLGNDASFDSFPNPASWLSGYARRLVCALPASGRDLDELLSQLGIARS